MRVHLSLGASYITITYKSIIVVVFVFQSTIKELVNFLLPIVHLVYSRPEWTRTTDLTLIRRAL